MSLLIIDNYDSFTYNLVQLVRMAGVYKYAVVKNDRLLDLKLHYDKVLISPGPGIASEAGQLMQYLQQHYREVSVLGICLGQEAIVELFGGKHIKLVKPLHGYRNKASLVSSHYIFKNLPPTFNIGHYHSWYADKATFPEQLNILVTDELGLIMAVAHKQFDVTGLFFHPESVMTDYGREMLFNWLNSD